MITLQPNIIYVVSGDVVDVLEIASKLQHSDPVLCYQTSETHKANLNTHQLKGRSILTTKHGLKTLCENQPHDPILNTYKVTALEPRYAGCRAIPFCKVVCNNGGLNNVEG